MIARGLDALGLARRHAALLFFFTALLALPVTAYAVTGRPSTATDDYAPEAARPPAPALASLPSVSSLPSPDAPAGVIRGRIPQPEAQCDIETAMDLWRTCDPIPRTPDAWDDALVSGRAGMLEVSTNPPTRLRIDGRSYGLRVGGGSQVTRMPIAPGTHTLDFISDAYVLGVRRQVTIRAGETQRVVLELRDALPAPVSSGGTWYQGSTGGRPIFQNYPVEGDLPITSFRPSEPQRRGPPGVRPVLPGLVGTTGWARSPTGAGAAGRSG